MAKQLHMEMDDDEMFDDKDRTHPGCIWGIFEALNYHYWQKNVRKMLPFRAKKYVPKGMGKPRKISIAHDSDDVENLLDIEDSGVLVDSNTRKNRSTRKRSLRTRIKALMSEDTGASADVTHQRFRHTPSIHHLEFPDHVTRQSSRSDINAAKLKNGGYHSDSNRSGKIQEETGVDVLDMYRVNRDLFSNLLKDTDGGIAKSFCNLEGRARLTRSGSYPPPKLSQIRSFKSSNLEHKQNESFASIRPRAPDGAVNYSRRTLSLNECSLEKYAQLLPKTSMAEPELSSSKSLRLTNECSFKRVRSLSRFDFPGPLQNEPSVDEHHKPEAAKISDQNGELSDDHLYKEGEIEHHKAELDKISGENEELNLVEEEAEKAEEFDFAEICSNALLHSRSISVAEIDLEADVIRQADCTSLEGFVLEDNCVDEKESAFASRDEVYEIADDREIRNRSYDDFDYVRDILDESGFKGNDLNAPWHSQDQPLSPSVFEEVEAGWPHESHYSKDEFCCHHQLLFGLINEVLVQIYDTWFTYYPRALSSDCRVPPLPANFSVLEAVWGRISRELKAKTDLDPTVDGIVAQDLWSDDRWMNLQLESECVALELEDVLFDEFLDEIICS